MKPHIMGEGEPAAGPAPTTLTDIVFPGATNHHGTLFGGAGLAAMDRIAFVAATRHGRVPFVTASCERVEFKKPAHVGDIVSFIAKPVRAGRRSLTVEVEMVAESIVAGERHSCTRGAFHMVAAPDPLLGTEWSLPPLATFMQRRPRTRSGWRTSSLPTRPTVPARCSAAMRSPS